MTEKTTAADAPGAEASMAEVSPEERARIRDNLTALRQQIDSARLRAGRTDPVRLLAATKTVPPEKINFAIRECGLRCIGENRVQELLAKYDAIDKEGVEIHFIGSLQTNKVKYHHRQGVYDPIPRQRFARPGDRPAGKKARDQNGCSRGDQHRQRERQGGDLAGANL